jgi:glycosyltransferase involved in cell wall biosynthesis
MHFIIHHPGKAGEVFLGLPMARLLKEHHPDCKITWVVLDLYRDSVGLYPYVDKVETIPTYSCQSLADVNQHMSKHRHFVCKNRQSVEDPFGIHIDAYYNYIVCRSELDRYTLDRSPFYIQLFRNAMSFCPGADEVHSWKAPEWIPTEQAIKDGEAFERQYGGGRIVIFSPYIADQSCMHDNQSHFEMDFIFNELRKTNLPVVATGTRWDQKDLPEWVIDGYSPSLSLGGLFYLIKNRAALVVSPNSGVGFAAHWLGAPTLMIDNRTSWRKQIESWRKAVPHLDDDALPHEHRWPPFIKERFHPQHMLNVPFEQIEWSKENFLEAFDRIVRNVVPCRQQGTYLHETTSSSNEELNCARSSQAANLRATKQLTPITPHNLSSDENLIKVTPRTSKKRRDVQTVLINCLRIPFHNNLGVTEYLLGLSSALSRECDLIFVLSDLNAFESSPTRARVEAVAADIISRDDAERSVSLTGNNSIELLPHHFQERCFSDTAVTICHDLHIFDVGWKYPDLETRLQSFRNCLLSADAVITHFPRTYYAVERTAGIALNNLFLTESPLMLDTRSGESEPPSEAINQNIVTLIYPAQLQLHKNHESLIRAMKTLGEHRKNIRLIFPGSDFTEDISRQLKSLVQELGVEQEIIFVGRLSDNELIRLYRECDGVIVPSLAEGGAYVPMEAIAAGKPVAVNDIEQARMHIKSFGGEVIWFDSKDVTSTSAAILQLATANKGEWLARNSVARSRIDQLTWDRVAEKWITVFDYLQGKTPRPITRVDSHGWEIELSC